MNIWCFMFCNRLSFPVFSILFIARVGEKVESRADICAKIDYWKTVQERLRISVMLRCAAPHGAATRAKRKWRGGVITVARKFRNSGVCGGSSDGREDKCGGSFRISSDVSSAMWEREENSRDHLYNFFLKIATERRTHGGMIQCGTLSIIIKH